MGIRLLIDLKAVFDSVVGESIATTTIIEKLIAIEESPWGDIRGKPLDARGLARRLKEYGIKPKVLRIGGTIRGYEREAFSDAWSRYLPPSPAERVTSVAPVTQREAPPKNYSNFNNVSDVALVTHSGRNGGAQRIDRNDRPAICSGEDDSLADLDPWGRPQ